MSDNKNIKPVKPDVLEHEGGVAGAQHHKQAKVSLYPYTDIDYWCLLYLGAHNKDIKAITRKVKTILKTHLINGERDLS